MCASYAPLWCTRTRGPLLTDCGFLKNPSPLRTSQGGDKIILGGGYGLFKTYPTPYQKERFIMGLLASAASNDSGGDAFMGAIVDNLWSAYNDRKAASRANRYSMYAMHNAHQIEVEDLKRAGLNPVLSALGSGGGASYTPGPVVRGSAGNNFTNTALALARNEVALGKAQVRKANAEADMAQSDSEVRDEVNEQTLEKLRKSIAGLGLDNTGKEWRNIQEWYNMFMKENEKVLSDKAFEFFNEHPYLYNFKLMGGSAQQLGNLNDWADNIIDGLNLLGKFRGSFRKFPSRKR